MPLLKGLTKEEQEAFIHKIRNNISKRTVAETTEDLMLTSMINKTVEEQLAKISEDENFNMKNRYRLQRKTLDHADKRRMPVDEKKIKDLLKDRTNYKVGIHREIGNYDDI